MQELLVIAIAMAAVYVLLLLGNRKKGFRYRQWWSPVAALLCALLSIYIYYTKHTDLVQLVRSTAAATDVAVVLRYLDLVYCLPIILVYALVKIGLNNGESFFQNKPGVAPPLSIFSVSYKPDEQRQKIVLRKEWVFPSLFLEYLMWISVGLLVLLVLFLLLPPMPYLPALMAFSVFIILESYWYLQHPFTEQLPEAPAATTPSIAPQAPDYYPLWEEYQKIWFDKILLAWQYKSATYATAVPPNISIVEAQNLVNAGYKLNVNDYYLMERLTNRNDVLIDDVISENVAPLLFSVFIRRLMDGENLLILTATRCTADSKYHQQVVTWLNEWFYKLTGNSSFWRVQMFSKIEDVQPSSRIIVTSANDILEKNVINHAWFDSLQTVLLLSGNEIFSEALTANNVLLRILSSKQASLQSIVLSDYREALQSSVARNLSVKSDLKEVRLRPAPPAKTLVLFWALESDRWFQHKIFDGHIETYMGAEALLSLLGLREKLTNVQIVGQEQLPYYEYLSAIDNHTGSLKTTPVSAQALQTKAVDAVATPTVSFLMQPSEHSFILARDTAYNLVYTFKKWQPYATHQTLLHVISPPYLLRAYFLDNMSYFAKTPLYPLSAKMMISRFEVARTLLERMVSLELSEREIIEEINRIKPEAIFVKEELQKLFRLAFGIDIIASNYLLVSSSQDFNRADDTFVKTTRYRLQAGIKDNINLKFLRNVDIIDSAQNLLKVLSADLLFQNYLPKQQHAFGGGSYNIEAYDATNRKLRVSHRSPDSIIFYRTDYTLTLQKIVPPLTDSHRKELSNEIKIELCEGSFEVVTNGYFSFRNGLNLQAGGYTYTPVSRTEVPPRAYTLGRLMLLQINARNAAIDIPKATTTLAILLHEVFYSLFPDTHQYIMVCGLTASGNQLPANVAQLYPSIQLADNSVLPPAANAQNERLLQWCIVEDAYQDLGLVQSIFDRWEYVLRVLDDYLDWIADATERTTNPLGPDDDKNQIFRKLKIHKTEFLQYGTDALPDFIDLKSTAALLRQLLSQNHLSAERRGFYA